MDFIELPDREHFSVREVAKAMDLRVSTIFRFMSKGVRGRRLRWFLLGARRRVRRVDIVAFLDDLNDGHHNDVQESRRDQRARQERDARLVEQQLSAEGF